MLYQSKKVLNFAVLGNPKGQGRPRFSTKGGFVRAYDAKGSKEEKDTVRSVVQQAIVEQHWNMPGVDMPISIEIHAYKQPPSGLQKWLRIAGVNDLVNPLSKPDIDNIAKLYMDAMNGIVYPDDKQVFDMHVVRHYSDTPRVEVTVIGFFLNIGDIKDKANAIAKKEKEKKSDECSK